MSAEACGCVYVPGVAGFELWSEWDRDRIEQDLDRIRAEGLRAVRFFLLWRDFEPAPGEYDEGAFAHLREFAEIAAAADLRCVPALLTIFVNGELLDLPWRQGRNLWTDAFMRERAVAFAARAAATLSGSDAILAYDIGDELVHVDLAACERLSDEVARAWLGDVAAAIHSHHAGVPVFQGCDASALFGRHPFGPERADSLDLLGLHVFPNWAPVPVDGAGDPLASLLPGFLVRFGRAFAPTLVDELGVYGVSEELAAGHLRAAGASSLAAGAEGLFAWFWQDVASTAAPYDVRPQERQVGMVDRDGEPKPALAALRDLVALAEALDAAEAGPGPIGVLVPPRRRGGEDNYLDGHSTAARAALGAYVILTQEKLPVEFVRSPGPRTRLLICPGGERLGLAEMQALRERIERGLHVWFTSWSPLGLGPLADLLGATQVDFTSSEAGRRTLCLGERRLALDWEPLGRPRSTPLWEVREAETVAGFEDGSAAIWTRPQGQGRVWMGQLPLELQPLSPLASSREERWGECYLRAARCAGIAPEAECGEPWLELRPWRRGEDHGLLAINHRAEPLATEVRVGGERFDLELGGKDFALLPSRGGADGSREAALVDGA